MLPQLWTILTVLVVTASATPLAKANSDGALAGQENHFVSRRQPPHKREARRAKRVCSALKLNNSTLLAVPPVEGENGQTETGRAPKFQWGKDKVRGVNLGNWFIYEDYMGNSEINNVIKGANKDQWNWDLTAKTDAKSRQVRENHWATWITDKDMDEIKSAGFNHVRIPIGYWMIIENAIEGTPYSAGGLPYLQKIVQKCANIGLHVIIDLHGLPRGQNGHNHAGHILSPEAQAPWFNDDNAKGKAWDAVKIAVKMFSDPKYKGIVSTIQLANEPNPGEAGTSQGYDSSVPSLNFMKGYFTDTYKAVREINPDMTVLFADGWFDITEDWAWGGYGKDMTNVAMDTHYYTLYDEKRDFSGNERLDWFCAKDKVLSNAHLPTMVGEWSVVVPPEQSDLKDMPHDSPETIAFMKKSWATQTTVYERGAGWTYWSWKTASGGAWSMQWLLEKGVVPNPITKHEVASHCF